MSAGPPAVEMTVTELRRSGVGSLEDTSVVFRFTGNEHSSNQNDLDMTLKVESKRHVIPGGDRVVEHCMHSSWQPMTFLGEWDDKWGNKRSPPNAGIERSGSYAFTLYQEFGQMVRRMPLVRVELDALSFVGIITEYKPVYRNKTQFKWSFVLSPHENENLSVEGPISVIRRSIPRWLEDAKNLRDKVQSLFDDRFALASLKTPRADLFTSVLLGINDALDRLQSIGSDTFESETLDKLLLMATTFRRLRGAGLQGTLALSRVTSSTDIAFDDIMESTAHAQWIADTMTQCWQIIGFGRDGELDMRARVGDQPLAIYFPRTGESLEKISARFYGTPDAWRVIYDRNNLTTLILTGSEELVIPQRKS